MYIVYILNTNKFDNGNKIIATQKYASSRGMHSRVFIHLKRVIMARLKTIIFILVDRYVIQL